MKKPTLIGLNFILLSFFMTCVKAGELGPLTYTNNTLYVTITDCASNASGSITVPNTIEGVKVTKIGNQAFSTCRKITSIKLGNNITDISFGAFWGCEKLESINIPNRVTNIGARAFSGCGKLESINIPQGISIIRGATFANCIELKEIIIPDTVETIEEDAFRLTYKLSEIVIPNKVTELPESAFPTLSATHLAAEIWVKFTLKEMHQIMTPAHHSQMLKVLLYLYLHHLMDLERLLQVFLL